MIASNDEGGALFKTSELSLFTAGGQSFDLEFRKSDKAERAYRFIIQHLK